MPLSSGHLGIELPATSHKQAAIVSRPSSTEEVSMEVGIYTTTFVRPTLGEVLDLVSGHGLRWVQFNLSSAGMPTMPDMLSSEAASAIREACEQRDIRIAALSGTFNIIHPDHAVRDDGMRRLRVLAAGCRGLGTSTITLSTGTRNAENMWRHHPDNQREAAWAEMLASMRKIAEIGEAHGVTMAFEPEVNNVVDSAQRARQLIDTIGSPRVKVVMDGANIFHSGELPSMTQVLTDAVALLEPDIALAHAKDLDHDGDAGHLAAGHGLLNYDLYLSLLKQHGFDGPIILHGLSEAQVAGCVAFLRKKLGN
jgi:sugar phosphate isomerase/epimerase